MGAKADFHLAKTEGKELFKLRKFVATEGVGRVLTLCVGLNFALSSSSSIRRSVPFLGSSMYLGNGASPFDV